MREDNTIPIVVLDVIEDALAVLLIKIVLTWIEYLSIRISFPKSIGNIEDVCLQSDNCLLYTSDAADDSTEV